MTSARDRAYLRGQLASVGIFLGEAAQVPPAGTAGREPITVDERDEMRRVLVAGGAPAQDLEWLVASCPSLNDARDYRPPARWAWCVDCGQERPCDQRGCITCREAR